MSNRTSAKSDALTSKVITEDGTLDSSQPIKLPSNGGVNISFRFYNQYWSPSNFIIKYEGKTLYETGFVSDIVEGSIEVPKGDSNELKVVVDVENDDQDTYWFYEIKRERAEFKIKDEIVEVKAGKSKKETISFTVDLGESIDKEVELDYFTLVGTAIDEKNDLRGTKDYERASRNDRKDYIHQGEKLKFSPGKKEQKIEISVLGDTPVQKYGQRKNDGNFEIFARDTAYRTRKIGADVDKGLTGPDEDSPTYSYSDTGYRVDKNFDGARDFQAVGLTSKEIFFVIISDPKNKYEIITKDSDSEKNRLLGELKEYLGGDTELFAYKNAVKTINKLQQDGTPWTYAKGTIYDRGKPPVLAVRGTAGFEDVKDDLNSEGVGYNQFFSNQIEVYKWLNKVREEGETDFKPHITGHSLGGALSQWFAANYGTTKYGRKYGGRLGDIVTFNSPGIAKEDIKEFKSSESSVTRAHHHITSTDVVSLAGSSYIPGGYTLHNEFYSTYNQWPLAGPHTHPVIINKVHRTGSTKPSTLLELPNLLTKDISSKYFTYLPDPDYFAFLVVVSAIPTVPAGLVPISGPAAAAILAFRGSTETARTLLLGQIFAALEVYDLVAEFSKATVKAAWNAAKVWPAEAWDTVGEWGEEAWGAVSKWKTAAWNATTEWGSTAWKVTKTWGKEAWEATIDWGVDFWDATTSLGSDFWNTTKSWSNYFWEESKSWDGRFLKKIIFGGNQNDKLSGGNDGDLMFGNDGKDKLRGNNGDDTIDAGAGKDTIKGGNGNDYLLGHSGSDLILGNRGDDLIEGQKNGDKLLGGSGEDSLLGGKGNDILKGGKDDDLLSGGQGKDILTGGPGADQFSLEISGSLDIVKDFEDGIDRVLLKNDLSFDDLTIKTSGVNNQNTSIFIENSSEIMVLEKVDSNLIAEADFISLI